MKMVAGNLTKKYYSIVNFVLDRDLLQLFNVRPSSDQKEAKAPVESLHYGYKFSDAPIQTHITLVNQPDFRGIESAQYGIFLVRSLRTEDFDWHWRNIGDDERRGWQVIVIFHTLCPLSVGGDNQLGPSDRPVLRPAKETIPSALLNIFLWND